jgi:hypothetical protein
MVLMLVTAIAWSQKVQPPATGCYHSAFTPNSPANGTYGRKEFDSLAQKTIAIEMFYTGWPNNRVPDFPKTQCDGIVQNGSIPHITWEPWTSGYPYPLDGIISGSYDTYILSYATQVKLWGKPLFIRVGHEMNGDWYPWGGKNNGGSILDGFGDPMKADGPERFIAAFRRIVRLFDSAGTSNVTWIWCPNNFPTPYETWNQPENYYPGDDVVDWIGFDGYNWGTSQAWSGWTSFYDTFNTIYQKFKSYNKPEMIGEFASAEAGGSKSQWIRDVFFYTKLFFTKIKTITWFNINKETDWRINSSDATLLAYQQSVADSYFTSTVTSANVKSLFNESPAHVEPTAFPNPTNGEVRISFLLPLEMEYRLRVLNILGQEVRTLSSGRQSAGIQHWHWDLRNNSGMAVPSGLYFAILSNERTQQAVKIIITK